MKIDKKEIINFTATAIGIILTVVLIMKPEKVEIIIKDFVMPPSSFVSDMKSIVSPTPVIIQTTPKENAKIAYSTTTVVTHETKKEVVKIEQVATSTDVAKTAITELKENPFEIVRYSLDNVTMTQSNKTYPIIKDIKLSVSAYHRQGTLATITKIEIKYFADLGNGEKDITKQISKYAVTELEKQQNIDTFSWTGQNGETSNGRVYMKIKIHAFTNDGGKITWGESDWIEVK